MHHSVLILGKDDPARALGSLAAAALDWPGGGPLLRKGQRLGPDEVAALAALGAATPGARLSVLALDADDIEETEAAQRLGAALAGPGVEVRAPSQGRTRLRAAQAGLLLIDSIRLAAANAVPDIALYTLFGGTPVAAGTLLAEAKIAPLATRRAHVAAALDILAASPVIEVRPFAPRQAALLIRARLAPAARTRLVAGMQQKLAWFGTRLAAEDVVSAADDRAAVAGHLAALRARGADLLLTAGGSTSDPADPTLTALADLGATLVRQGVPIHPGSLLWVATHGPALIVGVPSCGAFSEQTAFDLLLPRLLALGPAGLVGLERLAEGGLLTRGQAYRFPTYNVEF